MDRFTGGCLCGNVRIVASGLPYRVGLCHCLDCRKHHGALFHASAVFPQDAVTIDGETRDYAGRFFCPRCGSPIFARTADEIDALIGARVLDAEQLGDHAGGVGLGELADEVRIVANVPHRLSTGKLLANMQRDGPKRSIVASTMSRLAATVHGWPCWPRPEIFTETFGHDASVFIAAFQPAMPSALRQMDSEPAVTVVAPV